MIQSIFVYGSMAIILYALGNISAKRERIACTNGYKSSFFNWDILFALFVFSFISGIRWNVGADHLSYLSGYQNVLSGFDFRVREVAVGFKFITELVASLNAHFIVYFSLLAFLQLFFIYYAFKNEKYLLPLIGIVLILGPQYLNWMNGIRQTLAACIFIFSIQFIKNRQLLKYIIAILVASSIHKSATLLIVFYFIPYKDYFKNRTITIILLLISVVLGSTLMWVNSLGGFTSIFNFLGYYEYIQRIDVFVDSERDLAFGPRRFILLAIPLLIIWQSNNLKKHFKNTNFLMFYNLSIFGEIFYNFFASANHIFRRPATYFTGFTMIITSYFLYYCKSRSNSKMKMLFMGTVALLICHLIITIFAEHSKGLADFANFKFFWDYKL
jgi:hypothetical protein